MLIISRFWHLIRLVDYLMYLKYSTRRKAAIDLILVVSIFQPIFKLFHHCKKIINDWVGR